MSRAILLLPVLSCCTTLRRGLTLIVLLAVIYTILRDDVSIVGILVLRAYVYTYPVLCLWYSYPGYNTQKAYCTRK